MTQARGTARVKLPGLDGLRAIAVGLVLVAHYAPRVSDDILATQVAIGLVGVDIFFVISGFLITHLLLREEEARGLISLPHFYARRALRILPPLLILLSALALSSAVGVIHVSTSDLVAGLLFARNYFGTSPESQHLWSLGIEEQFYLVWPVIMSLLARRHRIPAAATLLLCAPIWRQFAYALAGGAANVNSMRTDLHVQPLLCGCLLALAVHDTRLEPIVSRYRWRSPFAVLALLGAIAICTLSPVVDWRIVRGLVPTLSAGAMALIVNCAIGSPSSAFTRFLDLAPLAWLGRLSYSLYLWQQPFAPALPGMTAAMATGLRSYPINILCAALCAIGSYYVVERPLLALRSRLRPEH